MFAKFVPDNTKAIGLLFSASYCKWCVEFVPLVKQLYPHLQNIEILLVGSDKTEEVFREYNIDHPWPSIPFEEPLRAELRDRYDIKTIPALIFVNADGNIIERDGRHLIPMLMRMHGPVDAATRLSEKLRLEQSSITYDSDDSDW